MTMTAWWDGDMQRSWLLHDVDDDDDVIVDCCMWRYDDGNTVIVDEDDDDDRDDDDMAIRRGVDVWWCDIGDDDRWR